MGFRPCIRSLKRRSNIQLVVVVHAIVIPVLVFVFVSEVVSVVAPVIVFVPLFQ